MPKALQHIRHWWNLLGHCERSEAIQTGLPRHSRRSFLAMTSAFTLAEVLITLAIIGIVAALTIPTLLTKFQTKSLETRVTKFYSQMLNAVKLHMAEEGVDSVTKTSLLYYDHDKCVKENEDDTPCDQKVIDLGRTFLHKYFKVAKDCESHEECFADTYSSADGAIQNEPFFCTHNIHYTVILIDGTLISIHPGEKSYPTVVQFDINGKKGPNKAGYDYFSFNIYHDGSINEMITPECANGIDGACNNGNYLNKKETVEAANNICKSELGAEYGAGCFAKFLDNGFKMDY